MHLVRALTIAVLLGLFTLAARAELATFEVAPLTIDTKSGAQHFTVEMALTPPQQEQGLMFRRNLAADAGMLFVLAKTETATFWMKNTYIPLDMLFIAADGHIADIHERAVPMSETLIVSKKPVRAVLELNGGTVARLGIRIGDVVHHKAFGNGAG